MNTPPTAGRGRARVSMISEAGAVGYPAQKGRPPPSAPSAQASLPWMRRTDRSRVMEHSRSRDQVRDGSRLRSRALEDEHVIGTAQPTQAAENAPRDIAHGDAIRRVQGEDARGADLHAEVARFAPSAVDDQCRSALFVAPHGAGF